MKIHETLDRDPRTARLANDGQARIGGAAGAGADDELRAELETFVCEGQFGDALQRMLDRYLAHLGRARQQSAWVSGFFGSGKSHLLKMLTHLWVNTRFPDGAAARTLVRGGLPGEIEALLLELDTQARRTGRPAAAAAGTLLGGSVDHVRAAVLAVVLRARGWPEQYPQARFCFWLRGRGLLGRVRAAVEAAGRPWLRELNNLYVSPVIAEALLDADPAFAPDAGAARYVLVQQFPRLATDLTTEQFVEAVRAALDDGGESGELPLTVLVLDEVQQYVNEAQDRSAAVTELAEAVQTRFDSRVLLVGAGQSALSAGTPALLWLRDRFRISVELTDADVEAVTRKVLLRKKPSAVPAVEAMFEAHAGRGGAPSAGRPARRAGRRPRRPHARLSAALHPAPLLGGVLPGGRRRRQPQPAPLATPHRARRAPPGGRTRPSARSSPPATCSTPSPPTWSTPACCSASSTRASGGSTTGPRTAGSPATSAASSS